MKACKLPVNAHMKAPATAGILWLRRAAQQLSSGPGHPAEHLELPLNMHMHPGLPGRLPLDSILR